MGGRSGERWDTTHVKTELLYNLQYKKKKWFIQSEYPFGTEYLVWRSHLDFDFSNYSQPVGFLVVDFTNDQKL